MSPHQLPTPPPVPALGTPALASILFSMEKTIDSEDYARLRRWLRAERKAKGYTMRSLSVKLSVPHSWVGKVELGERRLDVIEYILYCRALEIDPRDGLGLFVYPKKGEDIAARVAESPATYTPE